MKKDSNENHGNDYDFFDSRSHGYVRVAGIEPEIVLCDGERNALNHIALFKKAYKKGAMVAAGPELGLIGYTAHQMFNLSSIKSESLHAIETISRKTRNLNMILVVGTPVLIDGANFNCLLVFYKGRPILCIAKKYLPVSGNFRESDRFVSSDYLKSKTINLLDFEVPIVSGEEALVEIPLPRGKKFKIGFENCEDSWMRVSPGTIANFNGANLVVSSSASNEQIGKPEWRRLIAKAASGLGVASSFLYVSSGKGEDTTDLSFGGHIIISECGDIISESKPFALDSKKNTERYLISDISSEKIFHDSNIESYAKQASMFRKNDFITVKIEKYLGNSENSTYRTL